MILQDHVRDVPEKRVSRSWLASMRDGLLEESHV